MKWSMSAPGITDKLYKRWEALNKLYTGFTFFAVNVIILSKYVYIIFSNRVEDQFQFQFSCYQIQKSKSQSAIKCISFKDKKDSFGLEIQVRVEYKLDTKFSTQQDRL